MSAISTPKNVTNLLESLPPKLATPLAKPWHYRRNGRYYLRLRTVGWPSETFTVSLRTTDRAAAMEISNNIQRALAYFQLNEPEASWDSLKERLHAIAQECLEITHGSLGSDFAHSEFYEEMYGALKQISKEGTLTLAQHRAIGIGQNIMAAANARLEGHPGALVQVVEKLRQSKPSDSLHQAVTVGTSMEPMSWEELSSLYMAEHSLNLKDSSKNSTTTNHKVIGRAFDAINVVNLRKHTREDMTALRDKLLEGRAPSTVNNLLAKLQAVMTWAVRADKLEKQYTDKLKITKGADSSRVAFTRDQARSLMVQANALPAAAWERWALCLLIITGARVGEISYLTKTDIKQVDGFWCIDINEDGEGKSIKNKHSKRLVPLVDGALGFDLSLFLEAVEAGALPSNHGITPVRASKALNQRVREMLGETKGEDQTLHSLRHHLISSMQAAGVPVAFAQAAAGQSSGTIAYNVYGSGTPVARIHQAIVQGLMSDIQAPESQPLKLSAR